MSTNVIDELKNFCYCFVVVFDLNINNTVGLVSNVDDDDELERLP